MATWRKQLTYLFLAFTLLLLLGCNDRRPIRPVSYNNAAQVGAVATPVAEMRIRNQNTAAYQMLVKGTSLYMSTTQGYATVDLSADPENPHLTFLSKDQITQFSPHTWRPDWYGSGALGILGSNIFLSGSYGLSIVNALDLTNQKEIARYPLPPAGTLLPPSDLMYVFSAIAFHPTKQIMYGFHPQDHVYTFNASSIGSLSVLSKDSYMPGNQTICCAMGATTFQNRVMLAMQSRLWIYDIGANGLLQAPKEVQIPATNVVSTGRNVYVQVEPSASNASGLARGIYVFDQNGAYTGRFYPIAPGRFAIFNDTHLYSNKSDGSAITIIRLQ